jgi:membrane-associated phospholipid phosphatase
MKAEDNKSKIIKIIALTFYFIICFSVEPLYRNPLFADSSRIIKNYQNNASDLSKSFFRVITELGGHNFYVFAIAILLIWFPLNKSYSFLRILCATMFVNSFLKLTYGSPRPFWINTSILRVCEGGYGNPSGHSMVGAASWLALAHIFTDYKYFHKENIILKVFIFLISSVVVTCICVSRVVLGTHSTNQVIFGASLGVGFYYLFFYIFKIHNLNGKEFFQCFRNYLSILIHSAIFLVIGSVALLLFTFLKYDNSQYEILFKTLCPDLIFYKSFSNDGYYGTLILFGFMGAFYSMVLLAYLIEKQYKEHEEDFNEWHLGSNLGQFYRILLTLALCIIPIIMTTLISGKTHLWIIFTFKIALPMLILTFCVFGLNVYLSAKLKIANPLIHKFPNTDFKNVLIAGEQI